MRSYDEFIEKVASTRWKKEFAGLSTKNKKALMSNYVDQEKIVKGIEQGNRNLAEKLGPKIVSNHNIHAVKKHVNANFKIGDQRKIVGDKLINEEIDALSGLPFKKYHERVAEKINQIAMRVGVHKSGAGAVALNDKDSGMIVGFKKDRKNPGAMKLTSRRVMPMLTQRMHESKKNLTNFEQRAVNAITLRHELDELRSKRNHGNIGGFVSHNAPDVIHRESANLAFMPKNVKRVFSSARKGNGEAAAVFAARRDYYGVQGLRGSRKALYGHDPYYDKKLAKKHVKDFVNGKR